MASGPILIFDKSTLQSLNPDESVWLDNFFTTNITPLFFIETLADLENKMRSGRTPEQIVGEIAYKTPDMHSRPNIHHRTLLATELMGNDHVAMNGKLILSGGQAVMLDEQKGVIFHEAPEQEAFNRWQRKQFLELERMTAKKWRRALSNVDFNASYIAFQRFFGVGNKPRTLQEAKVLADCIINGPSQRETLIFGLQLLGFSPEFQAQIVGRWENARGPRIQEFAPYFYYVFSVDMFFYLAIAADLIRRAQPSHTRIDIAYLYYLPFCMVFTSKDKLHADTVPLFLREDQSFVEGSELKADLSRLDTHYSSLPEDVKRLGLHRFAAYPPTDDSFLVTQLWTKHQPAWRQHETEAERRGPLSKDLQDALLELVKQYEEESKLIDAAAMPPLSEVAYMTIQNKVNPRKGKWIRFPPGVENAH